ncbi:MAG: class I SAM-dependent methyltransferase [Fimbriiglobus sp.]
MTGTTLLPLPPIDLRVLVGPQDDQDFDNPTGQPIYPHLPPEAYRSVFDFGCGCGRLARKLIQQSPRPKTYVGIDPHPALIDWATAHLTRADANFKFYHHDVYSPGYAPRNSTRLSDVFPVADGSSSLVIAHSVFTHLSRDQTGYYLSEFARILTADGVAFTSWFFFDNASTPFFKDGPHALYADEKDFSAAVLYDRQWFLKAIRQVGLVVTKTVPPTLPGHQWEVWLGRRKPDSVDQFPTGEEGAEFLCGATLRPRAAIPDKDGLVESGRTGSRVGVVPNPTPISVSTPPLYGALAELAAAREEAAKWRRRAVGWRALRKVASWFGQ